MGGYFRGIEHAKKVEEGRGLSITARHSNIQHRIQCDKCFIVAWVDSKVKKDRIDVSASTVS